MTDKPSSSDSWADVFGQRRQKLAQLRSEGWRWPNHFQPSHSCSELASVQQDPSTTVRVCGRLMAKRDMGSVLFFKLRDGGGEVQLYVSKKVLGAPLDRPDPDPDSTATDVGGAGSRRAEAEDPASDRSAVSFDQVKAWDIGDIVGAAGALFHTRSGELSVRCQQLCLLSKNLHPLPDKYHGLTDINLRYRRRYLDLLAQPPRDGRSAREVFVFRSRMIKVIRDYLEKQGFLEVETPMLQSQAGGAAARPFVTHHNALAMQLYLRVSPELYLKRLLVGGFDKLYELNRNFRNEGLSPRHNPEFTMLEFYEAYQDYRGMMKHTHQLLIEIAERLDCHTLKCGQQQVSLKKEFACQTLEELVLAHHPQLSPEALRDAERLTAYCAQALPSVGREQDLESDDAGGLLTRLFDQTVEHRLLEPTFVTHHPASVSPLARVNDDDPFVSDRFELIINGQEICNGFSENNDPQHQRQVFERQLNNHIRAEQFSLSVDEDFLTALEVGMPPAAGQGIGIDRLVMQLTGCASIKDVIFFPLTRPEG